MRHTFFAFAIAVAALSASAATVTPATVEDPLDAETLAAINVRFSSVTDLANQHDLKALRRVFWQSPPMLLVAKGADAFEENWTAFWGNDSIDQILYDIAAFGPVVLKPDLAKPKVVGVTRDLANPYAPS